MKLVVGLGNPGKEYENTRHNIGYELADMFAKKYDCSFRTERKFEARRNPWSIFLSRAGKLTRIPVKKDIKKSLRWL